MGNSVFAHFELTLVSNRTIVPIYGKIFGMYVVEGVPGLPYFFEGFIELSGHKYRDCWPQKNGNAEKAASPQKSSTLIWHFDRSHDFNCPLFHEFYQGGFLHLPANFKQQWIYSQRARWATQVQNLVVNLPGLCCIMFWCTGRSLCA